MSSTSGASGSGRVGVRRSVRRSAAPNAAQNTVQAFEALRLSKSHHLIFVLLPFHVYRIKRSYVGFPDGLYTHIFFFSLHPLILSHDPYYIALF